MPKYTKEFKIKLVMEYLSGETGGIRKLADKYNIPKGTIENWIDKYNSGGFDNLSKKQNQNNISFRQTAEHFNIKNGSIICNWERAYRQRGLSGLEDNRGRPKKDMTKSNKKSKPNTPINESEREELIRLREENRLLKMKIIYEKKLQALLLEEEAEARKRQR